MDVKDMPHSEFASLVYDTLNAHLPGWNERCFILMCSLKHLNSGRGFADEREYAEFYAGVVREFVQSTFPDDVTGVRVTVGVEDVADQPNIVGDR